MRTIRKGEPDRELAQRHQNPPQTSKEARAAWDNYRGELKAGTRARCLAEQYHLCAYSEVDLAEQALLFDVDGKALGRHLGMHLEHIQPKSRYPQQTFAHENIVVSAIDNAKKRDLLSSEIFGGHAKKDWFHPEFIHPLLENCRDYFFFEASTGKVVPKRSLPRRERAKARLTIYCLNLNSPVLMLWRKTWLTQLEKLIDELLPDLEALEHFGQCELLPTNGRLRSFHSAQRQLFGRLGEQICQAHEPPL